MSGARALGHAAPKLDAVRKSTFVSEKKNFVIYKTAEGLATGELALHTSKFDAVVAPRIRNARSSLTQS